LLELWRQLLGVAIDSKNFLGTESRKKTQEMPEQISHCDECCRRLGASALRQLKHHFAAPTKAAC
jgi:hypothetical protein